MDELSVLLTDECLIKFANGDEIRGAAKVSDLILRCCREYNRGFMEAATIAAIKGFAVGAVLAGTGIAIGEIIKAVKTKKSEKEA